MLPLAAGVAVGGSIIAAMYALDMLRERSGQAVLLAAIAAFYVVFALIDGHAVVFHIVMALAFFGLAAIGFRTSATLIALGIIAHGLFDLFVAFGFNAVGPAWWPAFCGAVDIVAGGALLFLIKTERAAP